MKPFKKCLAIAVAGMSLAFMPAASFASTQSGTVAGLSYLDGRVFFTLNGVRTATPGCDCCGRWEIFISDSAGRALLDLILSAYQQGKTVNVTGTNVCVATGNDTEGVSQATIS